MTASRLRFSLPGANLAQAKARARAVYRAVGAVSSPVVNSIWTDTLLRAGSRPAVMAAEMYRRSEYPFVSLRDRASWPR